MITNPKILLLDIETTPMEFYGWSLGEQHVGLDQIKKDWSILCWCAKWLDKKEVFFQGTQDKKDKYNDKDILKPLRELLDEADIIITQNGKKFDAKKINARFFEHGIQEPSSYRHLDVLIINRSKFSFTSNKLAYITEKFNGKYKKLDHKRYPGLKLWTSCIAGDTLAWKDMEKYNKHDVLSLEEYFNRLLPWIDTIDFNVYSDKSEYTCSCGSREFASKGYKYTNSGKYKRSNCVKCGKHHTSSINEFDAVKKASLRKKV